MNIGQFNNSISQAAVLLKEIGVFKMRPDISFNNKGVSDAFKDASQKESYYDAYKAGITNYDFDILMHDDSFLQFSFSNTKEPDIRYAYFQNPQEYISYSDYLELLKQREIINDEDDEIGDMFTEEYEQFLLEQQINAASTTIRFDYDLIGYRPLIHSVSHIHLGHNNNIRIPCNKILTPLNFTLFILKHTYYHNWKQLIEEKSESIFKYLAEHRKYAEALNLKHWIESEQQEFFIT